MFMYHPDFFEIDLPAIVVCTAVIAILFLQLLLCRKAKTISIKLIPIAVLTLSTIIFFVCTVRASNWDALGYLFFTLLSVGLIFVCCIGWGIWVIIRKTGK